MFIVRRFFNTRILATSLVALAAFVLYRAPLLRPQSTDGAHAGALEIVGRLTGDDVAVTGAVSMDVENGRSTATLASGSDVTVRSGQAKIDLVEGGDIAICGPAHFSVLKSGGAITVALDYGRLHPQLESAAPLAIYTPLIVATPVAVAQGSRDVTVGLDQTGEMCAYTSKGAVRVEQQLTGQSLLVPQGGEVDLTGGELSTLRQISGSCSCDLMVASNASAQKQLEFSVPIHPSTSPAAHPATVPPPAPSVETVYRVDMPPLIFDAKSPTPPPDPDPSTMLLVRESHVAPEVVFHGRVEAVALRVTPAQSAQTKAPASATQPQAKPSLIARFFGLFYHKAHPCAGSGCGDSGS